MGGFFLWLWQLPQHLLGLLLIAATRAEKRELDGTAYWHFERRNWFSRFVSGVSLGGYILLPERRDLEATVPHEWGHSRQSVRLGWLYLPTVGIYSSVFCNLWDRVFHKKWNTYDRVYWYYKTRWTERWADRLGRVDRDAYLRRFRRPADSRYPEA